MKNQKLAKKESVSVAPGSPGIEPRWTSSSKSGIGKSINAASNVTFTLSHGILNEVFFPREDIACIRDMELIVTDGEHFFSEEKRDTTHEIEWMEEGVPAFHITNTCRQNKWWLENYWCFGLGICFFRICFMRCCQYASLCAPNANSI